MLRRILILASTLALIGMTAGGVFVASLLKDLPNPAEFEERRVAESTKIYDRTGQVLLYEIHGEEKRTVIPFEQIPASVKQATLVLEDANFYSHLGIDLKGVARAFLVDLRSKNLSQGGSTITQQLVKNSILSRERTIQRKIKEALMAILLESKYSKDEILELYLNQIPYGSNAYGIEAAAQTYFATSTENLTLAQASTLAAMPKAPSYYLNRLDELMARKDGALEKMAKLGYISEDEAGKAKEEKIIIRPRASAGIRAPHFVMYVKEILAQTYGEEAMEEGGLVVRTTLDWKLQEEAERIIKEGAEFNEKAIAAYNAALVAIAPQTGEILAMVGSRDWHQSDPLPEGCAPGVDCLFDPKVNVTTSLRQPGSAFKPFAYATAFKKGYTPDTVLFDLFTEFNPLCDPAGRPADPRIKEEDCYHPGNYDEKFRGPVSLRSAIAQSINVPSVKVLYLAGIEDSMQTAEAMGITTLGARSRFGLSLVLGGAEVRLLEMVSAYGVFANEGALVPYRAVLKVETKDRVLEETQSEPRQVIDTEVARMINDVLSDDDARTPMFRPHGTLWLPDRPVAAKTGTTQEYRDAWTIGYTPSLAVGVWSGNNFPASIQQKGSGVLAAAPMWNKFMRFAAQDTLPEFFNGPDYQKKSKPALNGIWQGEEVVKIDSISGKLATELTPEETVREAAFGRPHIPLYWIDKDDPEGPPPEDPNQDPQYKNWDAAFQMWLASSEFAARPLDEIPSEFDDIHTPENKPKIIVEDVADNGESYIFTLSVAASYPLKEVNALFFDSLVASGRPYGDGKIMLSIKKSVLGSTDENLVIRAYDKTGNWNETAIPMGALIRPF